MYSNVQSFSSMKFSPSNEAIQPNCSQRPGSIESNSCILDPLVATSAPYDRVNSGNGFGSASSQGMNNLMGSLPPVSCSDLTQYNARDNEAAENLMCLVCGDKATGKNFGVNSCSGCKGFFRRTIRNRFKYTCRQGNNCQINKYTRNSCKSCRFKKSLDVGMKPGAVQNERDTIMRRKSTDERCSGEELVSSSSSEIGCQLNYFRKMATAEDIRAYMEGELFQNLQNWAQGMPYFKEVSDADKVALLKWNKDKNLVLELAQQSLDLEEGLALRKDLLISIETSDQALKNVALKIIHKLVKKLASLKVQPPEFACLRALAFFDPNADHLTNWEQIAILQNDILEHFKNYLCTRYSSPHRAIDFLLLLPTVHLLAKELIKAIERSPAQFSGFTAGNLRPVSEEEQDFFFPNDSGDSDFGQSVEECTEKDVLDQLLEPTNYSEEEQLLMKELQLAAEEQMGSFNHNPQENMPPNHYQI